MSPGFSSLLLPTPLGNVAAVGARVMCPLVWAEGHPRASGEARAGGHQDCVACPPEGPKAPPPLLEEAGVADLGGRQSLILKPDTLLLCFLPEKGIDEMQSR